MNGAVSSLKLLSAETVLIGTEACEIYSLKIATFDLKLLITCNTSTVYDIAFPQYVFLEAPVFEFNFSNTEVFEI